MQDFFKMRFVEDSSILTLDFQTTINQNIVMKYFLSMQHNILCVKWKQVRFRQWPRIVRWLLFWKEMYEMFVCLFWRNGPFPLMYYQWHMTEYYIQLCLAGLKDVDRSEQKPQLSIKDCKLIYYRLIYS